MLLFNVGTQYFRTYYRTTVTHNVAPEHHLDGLAKYILFQHTKLASWKGDSNDLINV